MSELAKRKRVLQQGAMPSSKGHEKAMNEKLSLAAEDQQYDSEAIARAVYDGMQDLRAQKFR